MACQKFDGGRGVAVAWPWRGRGVAVAWPWRGRGVAVAIGKKNFRGRGYRKKKFPWPWL